MEIKILFNEFKNALEKVEKLNIKSKNLPIIENLLLKTHNGEITLIKNDLQVYIKADLTGEIIENGEILIPESTLKLIKNIKSNGYIMIDNEKMIIDTKVIKFKNLNVNYYPKVEINAFNEKFKVSEKELCRLLTCKYALAKDECRPILTGINIKDNEFISLDGYRMSVRHSVAFNSDLNVVINNDTIKLLDKVLNKNSDKLVTVYMDDYSKYIRFSFNNINIEGKLLEGNYINYKSIIPNISDATTVLNVNDKETNNKFKLFNNIGQDKKIVKFDITEDNVIISASDEENTIEDNLECSITGENLKIAFNNKYVLEAIKQYENDFNIYLTSSVSPIVISKDNKNLELVLPVRLE